ncbi:S9 family peptidase [Paludibaculum fermentans]|uniref:S9 family peptidase n=1 Tax=Paludibaculum fermentans TaxID=1473598 RepID=A0A7S7NRP3_PALFE|nr:S9 family peptidase [Paludibaculum fermentans]QOY88577.1 S9 family peptidase [Paludibaculum fermentans]
MARFALRFSRPAAFAFLVIGALAQAADLPKVPSIEQSLNFSAPGSVRISPDGQMVVYTAGFANWEDNEFRTQVWLAKAAGGAPLQLTQNAKGASAPQWSPDGKWISFVANRDGKKHIWLIAPQGGEAWQLTSGEAEVQAYEWSPDGKKIAFTSSGAESKTLKDRKEKYGEYEVVGGDYTYTHLYVAELPAEVGGKAKAEALTSGDGFTVNEFSWSPDSTRIAFSAPKDVDLSHGDTADIYVLNVKDKGLKKLVDAPGPDSNPHWSPDGKWIAYETANGEPFYYFKNSRLAAVSAEGGPIRLLTSNFDEEPSLIDWTDDGIWFSGLQKTAVTVFLLDPKQGTYRAAFGDARFLPGTPSFSKDRRWMAFTGSALDDFTEVYLSPVAPFEPKALTSYRDQYKEFRLATSEVISWKSKDDTVIEGVLIKPADFQAGKQYPLLVVIHGGPTGVDRPYRAADRYYPVEQFAAKGAIILRPNYRGSAGYGEEFRSLNVRNLGVGDAWDVLSGVDSLVAQGMVDPERVGCMGWSQGGYISAFLTTGSDRFKAISVGAGISDWMTYYVNTDIHPFTRQYLKATPWEDPEIYRKTSPITNIKQARTPTLIQHGGNDQRVPLPNAYELYQGLKDQGVEARLVVYKGFGHGINKPKQQRHVMEDNLAWFTKWIWGEGQ